MEPFATPVEGWAPAAEPSRRRQIPVPARFVLELIPSAIFMGIYYSTEEEKRIEAIITASIAEACASCTLGLAFLAYTRKVPWLMVEATVLSSFSAAMTYVFDSDLWFKMKGTVIPAASALAIVACLRWRHNLLQMALGPYYTNLLDEGWRVLALRTAAFQLLMAALNEVLWRSLAFDTWLATMRVAGPIASLVFATFIAPILVHYQLRSRLSRPAETAPLAQIVQFGLSRPPGKGGAPSPIELVLGPPGPAGPDGLSGTDDALDGVSPIELLCGSRVELSVWVRPRARSAAAPDALRARIAPIAALCMPMRAVDVELRPTGAQRWAGARAEFELRGSVAVPVGLRCAGHWIAIVSVLTRSEAQLLAWMGSVVLVRRFSARTIRPDGALVEDGSVERDELEAATHTPLACEPVPGRREAGGALPFTEAGRHDADVEAAGAECASAPSPVLGERSRAEGPTRGSANDRA